MGKQDVLFFKELVCVFQEVFETENPATPKETYLQSLLDKPGFIVYAVICKNTVIGGLTAYELPMYYGEYAELLIYDIAIKTEYQRKKIGAKLILTLKEYCKYNGIREFFVPANEEDKHALDFYHHTGGIAEKVVHFNYEIKPIRDGDATSSGDDHFQ